MCKEYIDMSVYRLVSSNLRIDIGTHKLRSRDSFCFLPIKKKTFIDAMHTV